MTSPVEEEGLGRSPGAGWRRSAGRGVRTGAATGARITRKAAVSTYRMAQRASRAQGAGESGLSRVLELHAFSSAGDAVVTVALAGTLFFQVPDGEARGQVALFLALTLLPFAVVAPLIGPFLDRFRHGRRWALGGSMAVRAFLCWVLATAVVDRSAWQFPCALGVLVASRTYLVARSAAVPRLLPPQMSLVKANARVSLAGVAGVAVAGPVAGLFTRLGPQWALRFGFLVFAAGTVIAILLPRVVDSTAGEEEVGLGEVAGAGPQGRRVPAPVVLALRCNAALRALSGYLVIFMAFLLRDPSFPGWQGRGTSLLALVIGGAGIGSTVGTVLGSLLRSRPPRVIALATLVLDAAAVLLAAFLVSVPMAVALGVAAGLAQQLGKLALDSTIQAEVAEGVRTSAFARSETLLQLSWVLGGVLGIAMPLSWGWGLGVPGALLLGWLTFVVSSLRTEPVTASR
ncbi:MAG TPA: MFS transporter [Dermatophilaceae bacterium]|nr:MFS transporter [Dermatophilaceae bacterium]